VPASAYGLVASRSLLTGFGLVFREPQMRGACLALYLPWGMAYVLGSEEAS
jgi:hypothetical protein